MLISVDAPLAFQEVLFGFQCSVTLFCRLLPRHVRVLENLPLFPLAVKL